MLTTQHSRHRLDLGSGEDESLAWELAALAQRFLDLKQLGRQALMAASNGVNTGDEDNAKVYWLRVPPTRQPDSTAAIPELASHTSPAPNPESSPVLYAQHIQTATLLREHILAPNASAIFAGVALSVDHNFSFYRGRLGLEADVQRFPLSPSIMSSRCSTSPMMFQNQICLNINVTWMMPLCNLPLCWMGN